MDNLLKHETRERMRALCREISVTHDLDPEIQEELFGHMEDKLLAYLDGQETVTEEDAFILVREHFGDPAAVKGLMHTAHTYRAHGALARRLGAAAITTLGVTHILNLARPPVHSLLGLIDDPAARYWPAAAFSILLSLAGVLALWLVLRSYQRRIDAGSSPWFMTVRPMFFVLTAGLLLVLWRYYPLSRTVLEVDPPGQRAWVALGLAILTLLALLQCVTWLWWCDRPPRRSHALATAAGAWVLMQAAQFAVMHRGGVLQTVRAGSFLLAQQGVFAILALILYAVATSRLRRSPGAAC